MASHTRHKESYRGGWVKLTPEEVKWVQFSKVGHESRLNGDKGIPLRLQMPARAQPKISEVSHDKEYAFSQCGRKLLDRDCS